MDMSMPYDAAVVNLSLSDPNCINAGDECTAFYAAQNASQDAVSWAHQFEYGHWATYYFTCQYREGYLEKELSKCTTKRIRARWPAKLLDVPADLGTILFLLMTFVFFAALVFAVKPYYRAQIGYGSPPIAIRSGLMAFACVPILVALAGKANIVTLLTGISHERLNVLHRWVAWISFALSLFHALPFLVGSTRNPIVGGEAMVEAQFYMYGTSGANEYTGVPSLAILFGICVLSLPYVRERFYESFYATHMLLGITYFGLLFWHSANLMDSWAYLWATLAVWVASWLTRVFWKTQPLNICHAWFCGNIATLRVMPGDVTRIDVWPSGEFRWQPSQHVFLRFPDIAPLDNHPFTVATVDSAIGSPGHLVFLSRAHAGFTRKLISYAQAHASTDDKVATASVWLDGPYGGVRRRLQTRYDTLILLAGGTGITACFPWLQDAIARAREQKSDSRIKRVVLIWAVKEANAVQWLAEEFDSLTQTRKTGSAMSLEIRVHVTGGNPVTDSGTTTQRSVAQAVKEGELNLDVAPIDEKSTLSSSLCHVTALGTVNRGRPVMPNVLQEFARPAEHTMVIGSGPDTFRADLGNAVAAAQSRVLKGEIVELAMHLETFGW